MSRPPHSRNAAPGEPAKGFLRQGLLILLPVATLALAGLYALRQDRQLAQADARDQARRHAEDLASSLWTQLTSRPNPQLLSPPQSLSPDKPAASGPLEFRLDPGGRLIFPPPAPLVPSPQPAFPSAGTAFKAGTNVNSASPIAAAQLWLESLPSLPATPPRSASSPSPAPQPARSNALHTGRQLLAQSLPNAIDAMVRHRAALLAADIGQRSEALALLDDVLRQNADAVTESGLPLRPLAAWKRLELRLTPPPASSSPSPSPTSPSVPNAAEPAPAAALVVAELGTFASNLVHQPTFLTPHLLTQARALAASNSPTAAAAVDGWIHTWQRHETIRSLASATTALALATPQGPESPKPAPLPRLFWIRTPARVSTLHVPPASAPPTPAAPNPGPRPESEPLGAPPASGSNLPAPSQFVPLSFQSSLDQHWLAARFNDGEGGTWITCRADGVTDTNGLANADAPEWSSLLANLPSLPSWFGYSLEIAGRTVIFDRQLHTVGLRPAGKGGGQTWTPVATLLPAEVLATATRPGNAGTDDSRPDLLRVHVHLVRPEQLFARQETRTRLFGALIGLSSLAALIGFLSARRAFLRQQQLATLKSNFVSSVSHELRAPIASVRLMAESLERGTVREPARQQEYFRCIVQECRRLGTLIENVLDFSRIEQGRKSYEFAPADITALVTQTIHLLTPAAQDRHVSLQPSLAPLPPEAAAPVIDGLALQQALVNLIDNALKHSPPGSAVTVSLAPTALAANSPEGAATSPALELAVADQGPGIPPEERARIFERFYRRGSELRRETQGIGLGLSLVKHVADAHGGTVTVDSNAGQGSRFTLTFPIQPPRPTRGNTPNAPSPA